MRAPNPDTPVFSTPVPEGLVLSGVVAYVVPGDESEVADFDASIRHIEAACAGLPIPRPLTATVTRRYGRPRRSDEIELCVPAFLSRICPLRLLYEPADRETLFSGLARLHLAGRPAGIDAVCDVLEMAHEPRRTSGAAAAAGLAALRAELLR